MTHPQDFTEDTSPDHEAIVWVVVDPTGTAADRKTKIENLLSDILTAQGDLLIMGGSGALTRLAIGTAGYIAQVNTGATGLEYVDFYKKFVRYLDVPIFDPLDSWSTGDGKRYLHLASGFNGMNLVSIHGLLVTPSTSGIPTIQIARGRSGSYNDVLTTRLTIDVGEYGSDTAANAAVINTSYDDVATNDIYRVDCDVAGTGTKGLSICFGFQKP